MTQHRPKGPLQTAAVAVLVALPLASCGTDQPAVCTQADQLRESVQHLMNTSLSENGMGSISAALEPVRSSVAQVRTTMGQQFQPQLAAVKSAVDQVQQHVTQARADPSATTFGQVGVALGDLQSAVATLRDALGQTC